MTSLKSNKRNFCVVTSSRAEFGILRHLLLELKNEPSVNTKLIVTGSHLSKKYGLTIKEIFKSNLNIYKKILPIYKNDKPEDISKSASIILKKLSNVFSYSKPDLLILLGDRYEILMAAFVATLHKIPIAHISGGETTKGSYDNQFRHSISKMSFLHFVSNYIYKKKLILMGENPKRIFNFGSISLDNLKKEVFVSKEKIEKEFNIKFSKTNFLVTYHPETLSKKSSKLHFREILKAVSKFKKFNFIFTSSNSDEGGNIINSMITKYAKRRKNTFYVKSFGQKYYFSVLKNVDGVIGNSSSGITEAPSFKIGTINVGDRQKGRIRCQSIIDCPTDYKKISNSIKKTVGKKFKNKIIKVINPLEKKNTIKNIKRVLCSIKLSKSLITS